MRPIGADLGRVHTAPLVDPPPTPRMGRRDVALVLAMFASAWPRHFELNDGIAHLWGDQLARCEPTVAVDVARRLVAGDEWPPSIARFLATYRATIARVVDDERRALAGRAIPAAPRPVAEQLADAKRIRSQLRQRITCPACDHGRLEWIFVDVDDLDHVRVLRCTSCTHHELGLDR